MTTRPRSGRYVALGSSFAAGPGINPPATDRPAKARQSLRNYPHLLAQRCGLDLLDVTSSGATVKDILHSSRFGQPPQITALGPDIELVTITIGGNDIGYIPSLIAASLPAWIPKLPTLGTRLHQLTAPAQTSDRLPRTTKSLTDTFAAIRQRAPHARIICVDYLTILPTSYRNDLPFSEDAYNTLTALTADLSAATANAALDQNVDLLRASEHSITHHAWSEKPWTTGWIWPRPHAPAAFHPTADGMAAVADLIKP